MKHITKQGEDMTLGEKIADTIANTVGSWRFVIIQSVFILFWLSLNIIFTPMNRAWDPYPFILLNLALSFQAAYSMPIIMMSQNRAEERDRLQAQADYQINLLAEKEIEEIIEELKDHSQQQLIAIEHKLQRIETLMDKQNKASKHAKILLNVPR